MDAAAGEVIVLEAALVQDAAQLVERGRHARPALLIGVQPARALQQREEQAVVAVGPRAAAPQIERDEQQLERAECGLRRQAQVAPLLPLGWWRRRVRGPLRLFRVERGRVFGVGFLLRGARDVGVARAVDRQRAVGKRKRGAG